MSLSSIKLIAFDLDGTLLNSVPDLAIAADKASQALGYSPVSEQQVSEYIGNGADVLIARSLSQSLIISDQLSPEILAKGRQLFDEFYEQGGHKLSHLYPNVKETLASLHEAGYTMALVTNKPSKFVPHVLAQHGIEHYFSDVIGGDTFPEKKPNPMALNWLLEKHGVSTDEMLMVGDSSNDMKAAKNAGCRSFGVTYGYNHGEPITASSPDFVADNIAQLLDIVLVSV